MKNGQAIGQVFIYVITIVLVSFLLLFGYRAITTFKDKADQVSFLQFRNDLQDTIEVLTTDFGSVKVKDFSIPGKINTVCFVQSFPEIPIVISNPEIDDYPIIKDSVKDQVNKNVFLIRKSVEESFFAGIISLSGDFLCFPVIRGEINLRMESKGNHVIIS